jgi:septal ring-binding cell division protein DamX
MTIHAFGQAAGLDDFSASKIVYGLSLLGSVALRHGPERDQDAIPAPEIGLETPPGPAEESAPSAGEERGASGTTEVVPGSTAGEVSGKWPEPVPAVPDDREPEPIPSFRERFHTKDVRGTTAREFRSEEASGPEPAPTDGDRFRPAPAAPAESVSVREPLRLESDRASAAKLPMVRPSRDWTAVSIMVGLALLALASYWFVFLRGPAPGKTEPAHAQSVTEGLPPPEAEGERLPEYPPSESEAPAPTSEKPVVRDDLPETGAENPSGSLVAVAAAENLQDSPDLSRGESAVPSAFGRARSLLDTGDYAGAAATWSEALRAEPLPNFTVQIAIACQDETLRRAGERTPGSEQFFLLPFALGGRPCYRLCWGTYSNLRTAQAEISSVPAFFLEEGGKPLAVNLQKALPPVGR